jgi:23S rRNA (pseudouridine1915-N3)-methyltransferase
MRLHLLAVGRLKDAAAREACLDYAKRVRRYQKLEIREAREAGKADRDAAHSRRVEGEALLRLLPPGARLFTLTRTGTEYSSEEFAAALGRWREAARDVALAIGGAHGIDEAVLRNSEGTISLSSMTFPHEFARLVLLEQLYRACTILRGEPYHKGRGT